MCKMSESKNFIYLAKINPLLSQDKFDRLLQIISKEGREKCLRFKFKEDALRTLYGELLVRYVMCHQFLYKNEEIVFMRSAEGKPYIENIPVHFNISHSGDFVICAFSELEIGIDIEEIKEVDLAIAERFFCSFEVQDLFMQKQVDQFEYFFSLWTLKESYLKWLGSGMAIPLDSFGFKMTEKRAI